MEAIKFYALDEVKDKHLGKVGTPHRDKYEKIGVQRSQVSKIESGRNLTLATVARVFKAMGMEASLNIAGIGSIIL